MKPLVILPNDTESLVASLLEKLAERTGAAVLKLDVARATVVGGRPRQARPAGGTEYDSVSSWPIDDRWLEAVVRYGTHHLPSPPVLEELWRYVAVTEALGDYGLDAADSIVAVDDALIPVMLSVSRPYTALVSKLPVDTPEGPLPGALALALHAAPIIVATNLESWFGLTNRGYASVYYCPPTAEPADRFERQPKDPFKVLIAQPLTASAEIGAEPAVDNDADRILAISASLLSQSGAAGVIALPGDGDDGVTRAADRVGVAGSLEWLGGDSFGHFSSADVVLVPPCDVYELERSVVRAAAYGKPIATLADLSFLNSMHESPVPAVALNGTEAVDLEALRSIESDIAGWFTQERSLETIVSRLERLVRSADSDAFGSASFYSLRQKRWELFYESGASAHYDEKYHLGLCYERMDGQLAQVVASSIADGVERPRILDLGCGPGSLIPFLQRIEGAEILALDLSPEMIAEARRRYPEVESRVGDCEAIDVPDESFDAVLCSGVLHHLPSLSATLGEIRRVLRPGGVFILREPTDDHFAHRHPSHAFVHLCLRHHLHVALGRRIVEEPEPHSDHRELRAHTLVDEVTPHLAVERVWTDLRVSYFYDMIQDPELFATVQKLESTLSNQPGMNLLMVARRSEPASTDAVGESLAALAATQPVDVEHLEVLAEAIRRFEDFAPLEFASATSLVQDGWRGLMPPGPSRVLALSDDPARLAETCAEFHEETMLTWLPLAEVVYGRHSGFDVVLVEVVNSAREEELMAAVEACRPYGKCYFELSPACDIFGRAAGLSNCPVVTIARPRPRNERWQARFLTVPMAYTVLDAHYALHTLLEDMASDDDRVAALRERTQAEVERLERTSYFSALRGGEVDRTIRTILDTR